MGERVISILSSDEEEDEISTPLNHIHKRPRSNVDIDIDIDIDIVVIDDPTPFKFNKTSSSTPAFVPETPFSDLLQFNQPPVLRCSSSSTFLLSGDGSIHVESDDEGADPKCSMEGKLSKKKELVPHNDIDSWLDIDSDSFLHTGVVSDIHVEGEGVKGKKWSMEDRGNLADLRPKRARKEIENCHESEGTITTLNSESLAKRPTFVQSTCYLENLKSAKTYDHTQTEDDMNRILPIEDHEKENVRLEERVPINEQESGDKGNAEKKKNKDKQVANRKLSVEEKRQKKEQEKLHKAALKAETARLKEFEKQKKKLEKYKFNEKDIVAMIDPKVLSGSLGGQLLTMFGQKHLVSDIVANPIEKSIVWRMKLPEEMPQVSKIKTDIPYILLIYDDAEEFCKHVNDGSFMEHISLVRKRYPSYTICFLTNRLMSFINKREQQKYKNHKEAKNWKRPQVEELFAKLTTQFTKVNSRHCFDESEVAEHVVGLTINLAKCHSRKKLTHLSVNANGGNVPKECMERTLILKHPWLKALVSIPKVQPRFAIAIWKKYPTMKSLLIVYMDPTKTVAEKESLLEDLPVDDMPGNSQRRVGEKCSKRVFRILMAQNGSLTTDDVEDGADYFSSQG